MGSARLSALTADKLELIRKLFVTCLIGKSSRTLRLHGDFLFAGNPTARHQTELPSGRSRRKVRFRRQTLCGTRGV